MMRIAIAGTGGLALLIASALQEDTTHQFVLLSRSAKPHLEYQGYQVQVLNYVDINSVRHALMGIDTVISTVTGASQLKLIEGAVQNRVRRFIPAEFEGALSSRLTHDVLDRGSIAARNMLNSYSAWIESTVITCGIFYERFAPGGLRQNNIGLTSGISNEGDYMVNIRNMTADSPAYDGANNYSYICLTSARDVARFVVKALDMQEWPAELTIRGERMSVVDLTQLIQNLRGRHLSVSWHNPQTLNYEVNMAQIAGDTSRQWRFNHLLATAQGRFEFGTRALNERFPDVVTTSFRDWFIQRWTGVP